MNVLNRILGGKPKSGGSNDGPKETLWQKASSLRQSLRGRPRSRRPASLYLGDGAGGSPPGKSRLRREWGSHRDLSREKRHAAKSWHSNGADDDGGFQSRLQAPPSEDPSGPKAWPSTSTLQDDQPRTSSGRSLRKLTKDSGYETSVQGEPDYVNRDCWTDGERDSSSMAAVHAESQTTHQRENRHLQRSFSCYTQAESSSTVTGHKAASSVASGDSTDISRAKSTTTLHERQPEGSLPFIARSAQENQDMGARRFRKASVYQVLANRSGLDFAPVVHQTRPWADPSTTRDSSTTTPASRSETLWSTVQNSEKQTGSPTPPSSPPTPPARSTSSHEKYPSWPVTSVSEDPPTSSTSTSTQRSHSWTQETDYPKEKPAGYVRPKKSFKINPHQLQPVLEKSNEKRSSPVLDYTPTRVEDVFPKDVSSSLTSCRGPRDPQVHSPPERDCSAESYLSKYDDVLRHYQRWNDAPLLQRLYQEGERQGWPYTSSATTTVPSGSQDLLKWHGSYSDLSALSVQISNRSSLFDSGHSTLPDSGRLSPQSSCDGSVMTLSQNESSHRVVSRLASQAVVAHSARVMQPKRHESESVLYYSTGEGSSPAPSKSGETGPSGSRVSRLRATFDPLSGSRVSMSSSATSDETSGERLVFLDPYKKHRVSDPELKAIQKQAVLSFYKRQTSHNGKESMPLASTAAKNRTLPRHGLPSKFSVPVIDSSCASKSVESSPISCSTSPGSPPAKATSWTSARSWSVPDLAQPLSLACVTAADSSTRSDASKSPGTPPCDTALSAASNDTRAKVSGPSSLPVVLRTEEERPLSGWHEEPVRNSDAKSSSCSSNKENQRGRRAQLREVPGNSSIVKLVTSDGVTTVASPAAKIDDSVCVPPAVPPRRGGTSDPPPPPRPPPKGSTPTVNDVEDPELKKIVETTVLNGHIVPATASRSPIGCGGSTCSSPDLPLPPPPPPAQPSDDPLPPPPEDLTATQSPTTTVYPKDSYMSYRSERQRSRVEGSYRRSYHGSASVTDDPVNNNNVVDASPSPPTSSPSQQPTWSEGCVTPEDDLHNNNHVGGGLSNSWAQSCVSENHKGCTKSPEELECERLSIDLLACFGDATLRSLLVPSSDHKTVSDYMEGLVDRSTWQRNRCPVSQSVSSPVPTKEENKRETIPPTNAYFSTSEPKPKLLTRFSQEIGDQQDWATDSEISKKKEELVCSISRKLDALRAEQLELREEMSQNEALGQVITGRVEVLARPNELDKYKLHVEELEKIVHLLLSLSGRLARVHNALGTQGNSASEEERRALEAKREKLSSQHEEARRLKESIDRRSQQVSQLLRRYLTADEYADYDHFVRLKSKLLVDARELDEKIRLGEEQLTALKASRVGTRSPS